MRSCAVRLPEVQGPSKPLLFLRLEQAAVATLGDEQVDLFRRVQVVVALARDAEQPQNPQRRAVEQRIKGRKIASDASIGSTVASAVSVGYCSASAFGTSSLSTSWAAVASVSTMAAATEKAVVGSRSKRPARRGARSTVIVAWAYAPSIKLESVIPTCDTPT